MFKLLGALLLIAYPGLVYVGLTRFEPMYLTLIVIAALLLSRLAGTPTAIGVTGGALVALPVGLFLIASIISNTEWMIRLYPAVMSLSMAALFAWSLWSPPSLIERIARVREPDFPVQGIPYTRRLTLIWALFLLLNAAIAAWTALLESRATWALYNGVISYVCVGLLLVLEYPVRRWYRARHVPS